MSSTVHARHCVLCSLLISSDYDYTESLVASHVF